MSKETIHLGEFLKATREQRRMSLRAVEEAIGVSNAYLSQIESGKIKQPSPVILYKLSELYDVSYAQLMALSGYPLPTETSKQPVVSSRIGPVTVDEEEALLEYLQFLRSKRRKGGRR